MHAPEKPTIDDDARRYIVAESLIYGGCFELQFCAAFDSTRNCITRPKLVMRGGRSTVHAPPHVFPPGSIALHTHPFGSSVEPSDQDITAAAALASVGVGFGICSPDARELYMISDPSMIAHPAPAITKRLWKFGRFTFSHWTDQQFLQVTFDTK